MFLTRLPCPGWCDHHPGYLMRGMAYFPVLGALIGVWAAAFYDAAASIWPPLVAAAMSSGGTLWLTRWSASRNPEPSTQHQQEELADVLSAIPAGRESRVRWHGQSWAASSLDLDRDLEPGERVLVVGRDGTQLQVMATTDDVSRKTEG